MAVVDPIIGKNIIKYGSRMIPDSDLYIDPEDDSYGRDGEPHITVLFGFTTDLSKLEVNKLISGIKPFVVYATGLNTFNNEKYDVVKFDIKQNKILSELNTKSKLYPHVSKFPNYHPHLTVGYVKKGKFPHKIIVDDIPFKITKFKYSGMDDSKRYNSL